MMQTVSRRERWVVYRIPVRDDPVGRSAVCSEREWDTLTAARPGFYALVRDGITSEGEAERFARGTAGDQRIGPAKRPRLPEPSRVPLYRGSASDSGGRQADIHSPAAPADSVGRAVLPLRPPDGPVGRADRVKS